MSESIYSGVQGRIFTGVKYLTYSLLLINVFLFLQEELGSLQHTFTGSLSPSQFVQVFAATLDTAAWVILLLLFELETSVLDDEQIRGKVKLGLHGTRLLCSAVIIWAFSGYCSELLTLYSAHALIGWEACSAVDWSLLVSIDEYVPLDQSNCSSLAGGAIQIQAFTIAASPQVLQAVRYLAWTDVINAAAWILVVIVLEAEVRLQLRGRLTQAIVRGTSYLKYLLYLLLFLAAVFWGFAGDFLDFWDASLWLFAFIFIELNVFDWQRESQAVTAAP